MPDRLEPLSPFACVGGRTWRSRWIHGWGPAGAWGTGGASVGGLAGVDLVYPGDYAAADVDGVGEAGALGDGEHLG